MIKSMKIIVLSLTVLFIIFIIIRTEIINKKRYEDGLNGLCAKTGEKMEYSQKVDLAVDDFIRKQKYFSQKVIEKYIKALNSRKADKDDGRSLLALPYSTDIPNAGYKIIYYKDKEEFLRENPECCKEVMSAPEGMRQTREDIINGMGKGYIHLLYKIKYYDNKGIEQSFLVDDIYYIVSNCGYVKTIITTNCLYWQRMYKKHQNDICTYK